MTKSGIRLNCRVIKCKCWLENPVRDDISVEEYRFSFVACRQVRNYLPETFRTHFVPDGTIFYGDISFLPICCS